MSANSNAAVNGREVRQYLNTLASLVSGTKTTVGTGVAIDFALAVGRMMAQARATHVAGNKLIFIGNGGSAAIASHMATDYSKNGGIRALALNDSVMLTCLGNDLGYGEVFANQVELYARPQDLLIAISSSGRSANILNA